MRGLVRARVCAGWGFTNSSHICNDRPPGILPGGRPLREGLQKMSYVRVGTMLAIHAAAIVLLASNGWIEQRHGMLAIASSVLLSLFVVRRIHH